MNPEDFKKLRRDVDDIQRIFGLLLKSDRMTLNRTLQMEDGRCIQVGKTTGTRIGTESTQKLAFFGSAPVAQQSAIPSPSSGTTIDNQARTAVDAIRDLLHAYGLTP
jgi:hypothetical protein